MFIDGSPLKFEPLSSAYLTAIADIERMTNAAPWSERAFANELVHPHSIFLVGLLEGRVIAYGGVWLVVDEAHITTVTVDDKYRRRGIGREIVTRLLTMAKEKGMLCATLEVRAGNEAAITLYKNLGFTVAATRRGYYPDNGEDARVMWLYNLEHWNP
jgi:ribosomal-protein-alanine N-acetyltransferase